MERGAEIEENIEKEGEGEIERKKKKNNAGDMTVFFFC